MRCLIFSERWNRGSIATGCAAPLPAPVHFRQWCYLPKHACFSDPMTLKRFVAADHMVGGMKRQFTSITPSASYRFMQNGEVLRDNGPSVLRRDNRLRCTSTRWHEPENAFDRCTVRVMTALSWIPIMRPCWRQAEWAGKNGKELAYRQGRSCCRVEEHHGRQRGVLKVL
jgi:hypothetical protein